MPPESKRRKKKKKKKPRSLKEALAGKLSAKELSSLVTSFDVIGTIAVIEIPGSLLKKKNLIARALMQANTHVKTVARIKGKHSGKYRVRPVEIVAGEHSALTEHREHGCRFKVQVGKMFFSPRLSHERERISALIRRDEIVGAFFAGVGPFPLVFAKHSPMKKAYAVELNPSAYKFLKENIELNKCSESIEPILGDVRKVAPRLKGKCDRIVMPLPKGAEHFLDSAFTAAAPRCTVHFYQFSPREAPFKEALAKVKEAAKKFNRKARVLRKKKVRSFSPGIVQVVIDFRVY